MKKSEFVNQLAEYCEFEKGLTLDTPLKPLDGYDSFAIMSIIAFVDEYFDVKLSAIQIQNLTDFNSLVLLIGEDKFNND